VSRLAKVTHRRTPLARLLTAAQKPPAKATALDVFHLARQKWLAGERIDIGRLAEELGVGRATVFRWVGSRELLHGEVISAMFATMLDKARRDAEGQGADYAADVTHRLLVALSAAEPLRRFVKAEPEFALRVLMSKRSPVEHRCTTAVRELLAAEVAAGRMRPAMDVEALAYVVVRIAESFLYRDVISGDAPDIETASDAIRILFHAEPRRGRKLRA
jgi:AcrR family transcriptional regulator